MESSNAKQMFGFLPQKIAKIGEKILYFTGQIYDNMLIYICTCKGTNM